MDAGDPEHSGIFGGMKSGNCETQKLLGADLKNSVTGSKQWFALLCKRSHSNAKGHH